MTDYVFTVTYIYIYIYYIVKKEKFLNNILVIVSSLRSHVSKVFKRLYFSRCVLFCFCLKAQFKKNVHKERTNKRQMLHVLFANISVSHIAVAVDIQLLGSETLHPDVFQWPSTAIQTSHEAYVNDKTQHALGLVRAGQTVWLCGALNVPKNSVQYLAFTINRLLKCGSACVTL